MHSGAAGALARPFNHTEIMMPRTCRKLYKNKAKHRPPSPSAGLWENSVSNPPRNSYFGSNVLVKN